MRLSMIFAAILSLSISARPVAAVPPETNADEQALNAAGLPTDGASLLNFFRTRTGPDAAHDKLMALVRQLGDGDIKVRAHAVTELVSHGAVAIPVLRHAVNDLDNAEVAARAAALPSAH